MCSWCILIYLFITEIHTEYTYKVTIKNNTLKHLYETLNSSQCRLPITKTTTTMDSIRPYYVVGLCHQKQITTAERMTVSWTCHESLYGWTARCRLMRLDIHSWTFTWKIDWLYRSFPDFLAAIIFFCLAALKFGGSQSWNCWFNTGRKIPSPDASGGPGGSGPLWIKSGLGEGREGQVAPPQVKASPHQHHFSGAGAEDSE